MKITQIAFLGVAAVAGGAAFFLSGTKPPPPLVETAPAVPQVELDDVLVAARELPMGSQIVDGDLSWQQWPKPAIGVGMIKKTDDPNVMNDIKGGVTRGAFIQGEPIRREKVVKGSNSGFLSAILPSGSRAVAINIDTQGATTAGGFILPNDRVDIIRTYRDEDAAKAGGGDVFASETILTNVRVLAIGQNVQEKNGERVVVGSNATLEVDPKQAELLVLAQRVGQLSLTLRSMADTLKTAETPVVDDKAATGITVVRYGVTVGAGKR